MEGVLDKPDRHRHSLGQFRLPGRCSPSADGRRGRQSEVNRKGEWLAGESRVLRDVPEQEDAPRKVSAIPTLTFAKARSAASFLAGL